MDVIPNVISTPTMYHPAGLLTVPSLSIGLPKKSDVPVSPKNYKTFSPEARAIIMICFMWTWRDISLLTLLTHLKCHCEGGEKY